MDKENTKPFKAQGYAPRTNVIPTGSFYKSSAKSNDNLIVESQQRSIFGDHGNANDSFRGTNAVDDRKAARRRKSLEMMQKSTQSKTIKNVIDDAIIGDSNIHTEGTAEERLHLVLTKAKEKSMTAENIFQFFSGNPNITTVSVEKFIANLGKLGGSFVSFSPEEIMILVKAISKNDDSVISLEEFKHYCVSKIQTIPWKAERLRLEESGGMEKLKAQISRKFKGDIDSFHSCGDEVFYSSKFFWRLNANIEIRLYYCQALKVVTIHLFNQSNGEELPNVYLCMNRIERKLSSIDHEVQNALKVTNGNGLYSKEELDSIEARLRWDFIAKHIVSILNIKESMSDEDEIQDASTTSTVRFIPYLKAEAETGDSFDDLKISKPINMAPPPSLSRASTMDDFHKVVASFNKENRRARVSRISAEELSSAVASALSKV